MYKDSTGKLWMTRSQFLKARCLKARSYNAQQLEHKIIFYAGHKINMYHDRSSLS